ncbi:MAG: hypothetical protein NZ484_01745 [Patescibacteria group bacterium]|nr:hypothetical protein [Patescibacteria group bacterium]
MNFEKLYNEYNKENKQEAYLNAYKEWDALHMQLIKLYEEKDVESIIKNIEFYELADQNLKQKADEINSPLPENSLVDLAKKYLAMIQNEKNNEDESM